MGELLDLHDIVVAGGRKLRDRAGRTVNNDLPGSGVFKDLRQPFSRRIGRKYLQNSLKDRCVTILLKASGLLIWCWTVTELTSVLDRRNGLPDIPAAVSEFFRQGLSVMHCLRGFDHDLV